jgi:putative spermidine/putrescine transport system permease protein
MRASWRNHAGWWVLIAPALLLLLLFYVLPVGQVLLISFTEPTLGFENYALLGSSESVRKVIVTTLRIGGITTIIALALGYALAFQIAMSGPRVQRWWMLVVLIPLWISVLVRSFAWVTLLGRQGVINTVLLQLGLIQTPLPLIWNEFGIIVGMVHIMIPFAVMPMLATMRDIDPRILAAARGLGAGRTTAFMRIYLPLSAPGIIAATMLVFILTLGFYITPALLGGGRTLMAAEWISMQILDLVRWGLGAMMATVLVVGILLTRVVFAKFVDFRRVFGVGR